MMYIYIVLYTLSLSSRKVNYFLQTYFPKDPDEKPILKGCSSLFSQSKAQRDIYNILILIDRSADRQIDFIRENIGPDLDTYIYPYKRKNINIYLCVYVCVCGERERERERGRNKLIER